MTTPIITRRNLMVAGAIAGGSLLLGERPAIAAGETQAESRPTGYTPVVTPNGSALPHKLVDGVKVFHLVAHELEHEFAPGLRAYCWGYNGSTPGPTIEAGEGDRVRVFVTNRLPHPTTIHWHGIILPAGMDGVGGLTQTPIPPGETYKYEFTLKHPGTFMYHPHFDEMTQIAMGMMGMFVVHPKQPAGPKVDRDFAIMLATWMIHPGTRRPDPLEMNDFNVLTMNSKSFPATHPLVAKTGQRVRVRLGNLSAMDHHPIHLHGHNFRVTGTSGGRIPDGAQFFDSTVLVPVGQTRDVEFIADNPGDWAFHCHMTHHMMNMMGHDIPNTVGVNGRAIDEKVRPLLPEYMTMTGGHAHTMKSVENSIPMLGGKGPFGPIDMGGMFTILKVRDQLNGYEDPGWYEHPAGTVASPATAEELATLDTQAPPK